MASQSFARKHTILHTDIEVLFINAIISYVSMTMESLNNSFRIIKWKSVWLPLIIFILLSK